MLSNNSEKEKAQLGMRLEANIVSLKNELRGKTLEVEEAKQLQEQLVEQVKRNEIELREKDQLLSAYDNEKQVLLSRINHLENKVEQNGVSMNVLAKQLELKNAQLSVESQKRRDVISAYKKLKSQQIFLLKKLGLTSQEILVQIKVEEASDQLSNGGKTSTPSEVQIKVPVSNVVCPELSKVKKEVDSMESSDNEISGKLNQLSNSRSPSRSTSPATTNWTTKEKPGSSAGIKRPASGWRETRSCRSPGRADPHDDFLDTPYDNIRGNLLKVVQDNQHDVPVHISEVSDSETSDDETQDMTRPKPGPDKQVQRAPIIGPKDFKYVKPIRKKAERENLNGIECKQCKKFYDAVLGDDAAKDGEVKKQNHRCEHHDGVSRHRYRYVPPMTPEGFWNIGFDTEN